MTRARRLAVCRVVGPGARRRSMRSRGHVRGTPVLAGVSPASWGGSRGRRSIGRCRVASGVRAARVFAGASHALLIEHGEPRTGLVAQGRPSRRARRPHGEPRTGATLAAGAPSPPLAGNERILGRPATQRTGIGGQRRALVGRGGSNVVHQPRVEPCDRRRCAGHAQRRHLNQWLMYDVRACGPPRERTPRTGTVAERRVATDLATGSGLGTLKRPMLLTRQSARCS